MPYRIKKAGNTFIATSFGVAFALASLAPALFTPDQRLLIAVVAGAVLAACNREI